MMQTYLDPKDIERLEKVTTNLRDRLLIRLLFRLGCRISEALALTVEDIDFDLGKVRILRLKVRLNLYCPDCHVRLARNHVFCPGCGRTISNPERKEQEQRKMRSLPVDADTLSLLKHFITESGPVERNGQRLLFGINRHRAWQIFRNLARTGRIGFLSNPETGKVRGVSPHRLRDAFATHAAKADGSADGLRLLQEHLGHVSFNTTARYRKVAGEEHRDWYEKLWVKPEQEVRQCY